MKLVLKIVLGLILAVVVVVAAVYLWASYKDRVLLTRTIETHRIGFPIPFPLASSEADQVRVEREAAKQPSPSDAELKALALQRAVARGQHLLEARYACRECHGKNLGGGTMVNDRMIGTLLGPNLTTGPGSRTLSYTPADWDRAVRHGVKPDGMPSLMPAEEFRNMSDQELSDIVSYIRSLPPVAADVPRPKLGPLGTVLLAVGKIRLTADVIPSHQHAHDVMPPPAEATASFGEHLAATCSGCHGANFSGGPIAGGDPSWPPAANLTPHADGLGGWTYDQFAATLRSGRRPDGTPLRAPMTLLVSYAQQMSDVELEAIWLYLHSLPPVPSHGD
jgi:mono/diheme cytochrome c family protein